jgi:hypothetical protein
MRGMLYNATQNILNDYNKILPELAQIKNIPNKQV